MVKKESNSKTMYVVDIRRSYSTPYVVQATSEGEAESLALEMATDWNLLEEPEVIDIYTDFDEIGDGKDILVIQDDKGKPYTIQGPLLYYNTEETESEPIVKTFPDEAIVKDFRKVFSVEMYRDYKMAHFNLLQSLFHCGVEVKIIRTVILRIAKRYKCKEMALVFFSWCHTNVTPNSYFRECIENHITNKKSK